MHWDVLLGTLTSYCLNQDQYWGIRQYWFDSLHWRHNEHDGVWNHQPYDCLLNCLFRGRTKKTSKLRVTGFCVVNSPVNSAQEGPVRRKMFPFDDVIMWNAWVPSFEQLWTTQHVDTHCNFRDWTWLAFVQVRAGPLLGTKALPINQLILTHHQLNT